MDLFDKINSLVGITVREASGTYVTHIGVDLDKTSSHVRNSACGETLTNITSQTYIKENINCHACMEVVARRLGISEAELRVRLQFNREQGDAIMNLAKLIAE